MLLEPPTQPTIAKKPGKKSSGKTNAIEFRDIISSVTFYNTLGVLSDEILFYHSYYLYYNLEQRWFY